MEGILEYKSISQGIIEDVDRKSRTVTGYASIFDNLDHDQDIIVKGAFTKSITERANNIFYLYNHNWEKPIDRGSRGVKLFEDEKGLKFEAKIPEGLSYGDDLIILYEEGIVDEHSIGFNVVKSDKNTDNNRVLKELKLWEFSAVTMAANPLAKLEGIKSTMKENTEKVAKILKALKSGTLTDDTFLLLEIAMKQLQAEAYELGKNTQKEVEPSQITQKDSYEPLINIINNFKF